MASALVTHSDGLVILRTWDASFRLVLAHDANALPQHQALVLEVGFGPGVVIDRLSKLAPAGRITGIDQSQEMVEQARAIVRLDSACC
jgi:ubiquinone/menaquinone biosynthesis C-methylase UbiE